MKTGTAKRVCDLIEFGKSVQESSDQAITELEKLNGSGGIIAIDHLGNIGVSFNTTIMSHGYCFKNQAIKIGIYK